MKISVRFILLSLSILFLHKTAGAQENEINYGRLLKVPLHYTVLKTSGTITIDGEDDEEEWQKAPWTPIFTDIENGNAIDSERKVQCKMLWDDDYLYLFARLQEQNIWASLTQHDDRIYQDNAFEIFIDPDEDNFNYFEFQVNALGAVWDLFLSKPYRNGGKNLTSWDIKGLKKAIKINGTINNPYDTDKSWNVELAIPFNSLKLSGDANPGIGTIWRMNFSRVQWDLDTANGNYSRKIDSITGKLLPEHYSVWSPQGIVNLHYPERWGYVQFSDRLSPNSFLSEKTEKLKLLLWKYYYLQKEYERTNGRYATTLDELDKIYNGPRLDEDERSVKMFADGRQFYIQCLIPDTGKYFSVDDEGEVRIENRDVKTGSK